VREALERRFDAVNTSGLKARFDKEGCLTFPALLDSFCRAVEPRIASVHRPRFLDWYKQGWKASDFFHNSPGQPTVDINPSLRFIHPILSPLLCGLLSAIVGSPVKMVQGNVCRYSEKTNRCLENHFDGCPFSAIVHVKSTDPKSSGLWIEREGKFEMVPTPGVGDVVLIKGDQFYHRSCKVEGENERTVIVFFLEYSNPKDAKREAEKVEVNTARSAAAKKEKSTGGKKEQGEDKAGGSEQVVTVSSPPQAATAPEPRPPPTPPLASHRAGQPAHSSQPADMSSSVPSSGRQSAIGGREREGAQAVASSDAATPSGTAGSQGSGSAAGRRKKKRARVGYILEEADKLDTNTKDDVKRQRDLERAKRRRRRALAMGRRNGGGHGDEHSTSSGPA